MSKIPTFKGIPTKLNTPTRSSERIQNRFKLTKSPFKSLNTKYKSTKTPIVQNKSARKNTAKGHNITKGHTHLRKNIIKERKVAEINLNQPADTEEKIIIEEVAEQDNKMNQQQIQQNIASFIPEFSGKETDNELTRFLGTATSVYDSLTTDIERDTFNKLIKFRLTGEAYTRIINRQVDNFPTLKTLMINMYSQTFSLDELENNFIETKQNYGESIRNYGYRLSEALQKYKNGYKTKYNLANLDETYSNHLNTNSVQTFKRGVNSTILKEKIATSKANNIDEIINETEITEKMLLTTIDNTPTQQKPTHKITQLQPQNQYRNQNTNNQIICNFCQKPNHTWDICRTRIYTESANQRNSQYRPNTYSQNYTQFRPNQYRNNFPNSSQQITDFRRFNQPQQQTNFQINRQQTPVSNNYNFNKYNPTQQANFSQNQNNNTGKYMPLYQNSSFNNSQQQQTNLNNPVNKYNTPQQSNFTTYRQNNYQNSPKYCSHCKTTRSHTFEECRSKFLGVRNYNMETYNKEEQPPDKNKLEENFKGMRINSIFPHPTDETTYQISTNQQQQENSNGSDQ